MTTKEAARIIGGLHAPCAGTGWRPVVNWATRGHVVPCGGCHGTGRRPQ